MLSKFIIASSAMAGALASTEGKNPIRRVVTLMQDMQKEIEADGEKEDELYNKFECYCKGNTDNMSKAAEDAATQIEELSAKVKAEKAEKSQTEQELKQHKKDRASAKQDLEKATQMRKKENETYIKETGETRTNIEQTKGAITSLEKGMGATSFIQAPFANKLKSLVQTVDGMDASDRETLLNFLQASGDYQPASGQIVGILKDMLDNMDKALGGIVSDEEEAVASFIELKKAKSKEIALATQAIETKTQRVGELAVSIVQNKNAKNDATRDLEDSQKFLANLAVTCKEKKAEYEERVKMRQEEIAAISEAISVLNDDDALDVFKASLGKKSASFLQRGAKTNKFMKAKNLIKNNDYSKNSPALSLLAHTVSAKLSQSAKSAMGVDFSSVLKMIDEMVELLKKEQKDDESHKTWCEGEFDSSDDEKKETTQAVESLSSSISSMRDEIAGLGEKIAALVSENASLDKSVSESTEQRKAENKEYTEKVQLNQTAIELIFKAKNRLQKFYNPEQYVAAEKEVTEDDVMHSFNTNVSSADVNTVTPEFIQIKQHHMNEKVTMDAAPEAEFGSAKSQKSNGVMGLMDKISKELEMEIKEAEMTEGTATKEYEELLADAQESKAANTKSINDKTASKADLEVKLEETKTRHIVTSDQLSNIKSYIADLHQSCDFITNNFENRREQRTAEIESLQNAKAVLSGSDYKF